MIPVPLIDLKSLGPTSRLRCRDFKSAALDECAWRPGGKMNADFIQCLATVADRMLILLDVDALIGRDLLSLEPNTLAGVA